MSSTENLTKVLFQLRKITILFFTDAAYTFADLFDESKNGPLVKQFRYYRLFTELPDDEIYKVYEHLCRKLPGLSSLILTSDESLFDSQFIQTNELEDACILPGVDFRHFFHAPGVTVQIKEAIWTYIQSFLMLTLNDCNPLRKENSERLMQFLQGNEDEGEDTNLNEFMQLFENMDSNANFEEITSKLNSFLRAKEGFEFETDNTMMEEEEDEYAQESGAGGNHGKGEKAGNDGPSASNFFDPNKAKSFMDNMSNSKLGRFAQEVMEDLKLENPELIQEFENVVKEASENGGNIDIKPMSLFKFILSKGVSLRTLVKKLMEKLRRKLQTGDLTMQDFQNDISEFMPDFSKMSQSDLKSMMEKSGMKIPAGAHFNMNMEKMKRHQQAQESARRMRERLAQQKKQAESAMNVATASLSGFSSEDAAIWAKNAHDLNTQSVDIDWQTKRAEIEKLFANNEGIAQNRNTKSHHKKKR